VDIVFGKLERPYAPEVEIVERKGQGHPDTLCDAIAERFSVLLSRFYLDRFGVILHHNVDKVLLRGGASRPSFGGGDVLEPVEIYLAGRAVTQVSGVAVPVDALAREAVQGVLGESLHAFDPAKHARVHNLVRPGSVDLGNLFSRHGARSVPLSNDTSFGVGFAPTSPLERLVLDLDASLAAPELLRAHPAQGEDTKVMAVRRGQEVSLTVARAMVSGHVTSLVRYLEEKDHVLTLARGALGAFEPGELHVNAADAPDGSSVYLTVTGTSAEAGDDGEVGRGNRANGLITPLRPMSLEALAGKNAVSHVGKLYNVVARAIAETLVASVPDVWAADCFLVSRIGAPINQPALAHVRLGTSRSDEAELQARIREIVGDEMMELPQLWRRIVDGEERLF
jgi:S-adenosylmethionine synthetase